jgi:hypothetical protein
MLGESFSDLMATVAIRLVAQNNTTTNVDKLPGATARVAVGILAVFIVAAGIIVGVGRSRIEGSKASGKGAGSADAGDSTFVRSWIAISLVGGLILFSAFSLGLSDSNLRSTLVGALVANTGAAVAFYFASKASDQARKDILNASLPAALVPDLIGKDLAHVHAAIASTPLQLHTTPDNPVDGAQVVSQTPPASRSAPQGSTVDATFAGPVPDLTDLAFDAATKACTDAGLTLAGQAPPAEQVVVDQTPKKGETVPVDCKVTPTFGAKSEDTPTPADTNTNTDTDTETDTDTDTTADDDTKPAEGGDEKSTG